MNCAYVAGFVDGEGCIGVYENRLAGYRLRVQIFQNHSRDADFLMQDIKATWGGWLADRDGRGYLYNLSGAQARDFLCDILPHLRIKYEQAKLAIAWYDERKSGRVRGPHGRFLDRTPEQHEADRQVAEQIAAMKSTKKNRERQDV